MSPEDTMALLGLVVLFIVFVGVIGDVYKRRLAFKERELEMLSKHTAEKAAQYAAQAERLEQRVRVLERIATDKSADVAGQIESLRDPVVN
ncbi:MAG: hypothetical protein KGL48_01435 [Sphingomonadales bacterium]|nr:hypothetical protein [Sphingomonadales bacterium]MDE2570369.1 hypothetical protein [Sphingomonadales bacterium]